MSVAGATVLAVGIAITGAAVTPAVMEMYETSKQAAVEATVKSDLKHTYEESLLRVSLPGAESFTPSRGVTVKAAAFSGRVPTCLVGSHTDSATTYYYSTQTGRFSTAGCN